MCMSVLTVTVGGTAIDYGDVELTRATSDALPAPEAEIEGAVGDFTAGESVTISDDSGTLFTGQVAKPEIRRGGRRDLTCEHQLAPLFEESVDVPPTTSVTTALENAVANASTSATVQFDGTDVTLGEEYSATGRTVRRIFKDLTERTGRVWRVVDPDTIVVEPLGTNGGISINTDTDAAAVRQFDSGDARTVINDVQVNGTGGERVVGTASDATSIDQYGTRSRTVNVSYIETQSEADAYAQALLRPEPLAEATVLVGASAIDVIGQQSNATLTLTDPSRGIDSVELVIEEQTNSSGGSTVLKAGEGAASSLVTQNRQSRSRDDQTEPGSVYGNDRIADDAVDTAQLRDTAVDQFKLQDGAVESIKLADGSVLTTKLDNLAVTETKIDDESVTTPKLEAGAVEADKIETGTITGTEFDRVVDGEVVGTENIISLLADKVIFADTDDTVDGLTKPEDGTTVIDGGKIETNSITADLIDTLDLDTDQLSIGELEFSEEDFTTTFLPATDGEGLLGALGRNFLAIYVETGNFDDVATSDLITSTATFGVGATDPIDVQDGEFGTEIVPVNDGTCTLGTTDQAFQSVVAEEFLNESGGILSDGAGDPLHDLRASRGPPDRVKRFDDDGTEVGTSINRLAREAYAVCEHQQDLIDALESRIDTLERRLSDPNA